jgi:hypothetical protein
VYAQQVDVEASGVVDSFQGGFGSNSDLGQSVTLDFSYDSGSITQQLTSTDFIVSSPIISASIVNSPYGSHVNLEWNGPGSGTIANDVNLSDGSVTATATTSVDPPDQHFTGDVYGFTMIQNSVGTTLDLIRDAYSSGVLDTGNSGSVSLANVSVGAPAAAPEMDPSTMLSALTLLAGGILVVGGRKLAKVHTA